MIRRPGFGILQITREGPAAKFPLGAGSGTQQLRNIPNKRAASQ